MIIFKIVLVFLTLVLVWHFLTKKYINPYKLYMVVGKKGSGKSTMLHRLAFQHLRDGWRVFSTEPIPGCCLIPYQDIGKYNIPSGSVLLVDDPTMCHFKEKPSQCSFAWDGWLGIDQ